MSLTEPNQAAIREILAHLITQLEKIESFNLDHHIPIARGYIPGDFLLEMCHTGEHQFVLRWSYSDPEGREKFEEFAKTHIIEGRPE